MAWHGIAQTTCLLCEGQCMILHPRAAPKIAQDDYPHSPSPPLMQSSLACHVGLLLLLRIAL